MTKGASGVETAGRGAGMSATNYWQLTIKRSEQGTWLRWQLIGEIVDLARDVYNATRPAMTSPADERINSSCSRSQS